MLVWLVRVKVVKMYRVVAAEADEVETSAGATMPIRAAASASRRSRDRIRPARE
jgi:hypothetical protein